MGKTVYYNGTILTMDDRQPVINTVTVRDGRIISTKGNAAVSPIEGYDRKDLALDLSDGSQAVRQSFDGTSSDSGASASVRTRFVDLKGAVLMPAFLDAHSHFSGYASAQLQVPLEEAVDFSEIVEKIRTHIAANHIPAGTWIVGKGYDHNHLPQQAHPTAAVLDQASREHPIVISHQSGHMGVFNTLAMKLLNITAQTPCPEGGLIATAEGVPTGYLEENAFVPYFQEVPMPSIEDLMKAYLTVQDKYASYGITTIQEGMLPSQLLPLYQTLTDRKMLKLDVVGYADAKEASSILPALSAHRGRYQNHFKLGGLKIFLDGSPQGRTAWMRQPYEGSLDYCGYNTLTDTQVEDFVRLAVKEKLQLLAHCNGDAAADQYLRACRKVAAEGLPVKSIRPVLIHGQLLGTDQLSQLKELDMLPSFFAAHVYHWGDIHIKNFGLQRASHISPAASALAAGIPFTFHQDSPVIEPDMLETIWCSVNRLTKNGVCLDAEAIPVQAALKAVTCNTAYQYFEEQEKGSIAPDKRADFVILDKNPLTVPAMELKKIRVLETIKDGEVIFER